MRRREFITLVCCAVAYPLAALAQQGERIRKIGVVMAYDESDTNGQAQVVAFRQQLRKLGWIDGRNIRMLDEILIERGGAAFLCADDEEVRHHA